MGPVLPCDSQQFLNSAQQAQAQQLAVDHASVAEGLGARCVTSGLQF